MKWNQQDEWVVCRVFQKSGGAKKYPSNHTRGVHPYSLEIGPNNMVGPSMMHMTDPNSAHFLYGRNYVNSASDLAEVARVLRATNTTGFNLPMQAHPHQLNYPAAAAATAGGGFTISGLNLNLAGEAATGQHTFRHDVASNNMMTAGSSMNNGVDNHVGYGAGEMSNANPNNNNIGQSNNRFIGMDPCVDLDNYWPPY